MCYIEISNVAYWIIYVRGNVATLYPKRLTLVDSEWEVGSTEVNCMSCQYPIVQIAQFTGYRYYNVYCILDTFLEDRELGWKIGP